jgi:ferric-dicitrate binding protein FerR (iron transport regulator)
MGVAAGVDTMNEHEQVPDGVKDLIDDYLEGLLDEAQMRALEERLSAGPELRRYFVRYAGLHTDLHLEARAQEATERVIAQIEQSLQEGPPARPAPSPAGGWSLRRRWRRGVVAAACLVLAVSAGWWLTSGHGDREGPRSEPAVAWVVNAQNCRWADGGEPVGDLRVGTTVTVERGLVEVRFAGGARAVLEGPASLELLSGKSARLHYGKLSARVEAPAAGLEIVSRQGKVIDQGTEFGIAVAKNGTTDVYVFEGKVEARAQPGGSAVVLAQHQAARIAYGQVTRRPMAAGGGGKFVRAILPPPVVRPIIRRLTFDRSVAGSIRAADGAGTGLTHRLPGTGGRLPERDPNLRLRVARRQLELTTTNSDLNTQYKLHHGEYLGLRLSDLGFTGKEDFAITATIPNIPALAFVGQFGLYAGASSDRNIRGGVIGRRTAGEYTQFLVNNQNGKDTNVCRVGLLSTGADLRLTLKRAGGKYSLTVANLTTGSSSALAIRHPGFLDNERELYVGLFGANTQSEVRKTLTIKELSVTVWTVSPPGPERGD